MSRPRNINMKSSNLHNFHYKHVRLHINELPTRGVSGTGFWNSTSSLKQYFVFPKNVSKHYLKYMFLAFPVLGIWGLGTPLVATSQSA